jgi:hypothetical protein
MRLAKEEEMPRKAPVGCLNPDVGQYLDDVVAGNLPVRSHKGYGKLFMEHTKSCSACRDAMLEAVNATVVMPLLRKVARKHGVPISVVCAKVFEMFGPSGRKCRKRK